MAFDGRKFSMIRGDSEVISITPKNFTFENGDKATLTVKKTTRSDKIAVQKVVTTFYNGSAVFNIEPSDTKDLDFGKYKYDIELTFANGVVKTLFEPEEFTILEECTY